MADEIDLSKLDALAPEARAKVAESLKRTLDTEIARANVGISGAEAAAHSRSKGFFFSRSKTSASLKDQITNPAEQVMIEKMDTLGDEDFAKFADRLAKIKKISDGG